MGINEDGRFSHRMSDPMGGAPPAATFSDEQFAELKRLLMPVHLAAHHHLLSHGFKETEHGYEKDGEEHVTDPALEPEAEREPFDVGNRVWSDGKEGTVADRISEHEYAVKFDNGEEDILHHDDLVRAPDLPEPRPQDEAERDHSAAMHADEPEETEEQTELRRLNDLNKGRPNQGVDQASLTGGESMQQAAERDAAAAPETEAGAAGQKDKAAAEGFDPPPPAPARPTRTPPGK